MKFSEEMLRLYAVTDRTWVGEGTLANQVDEAIRGGATLVQLREKNLDEGAFLEEAKEILSVCHRHGVPLIINDNVDIAVKIGADGVHVGQEDLAAADVRAILGDGKILGVTAKTVEQAKAAEKAGADYLGSGAIFGSTTKTNARPMTKQTLCKICDAVTIPVVAIGGIGRDNILELANTNIRGAAIVSGIFAAADIEAECRLLRERIETIVSAEAKEGTI